MKLFIFNINLFIIFSFVLIFNFSSCSLKKDTTSTSAAKGNESGTPPPSATPSLSLQITSPNGGVNFTTTSVSQTISGTCSTEMTNLTSNIGSFSDSDCSNGTWTLNPYYLNGGTNTFTITAENSSRFSSSATITITYSLPQNCTLSIPISKIVYGAPVIGTNWPATVAVTNTSSYFCSGTLVAPDLVLTAAHCITFDKASSELTPVDIATFILNGRVYTGNGLNGGSFSGQSRIIAAVPHPSFDGGSGPTLENKYDFGYLILKQPITDVTSPQIFAYNSSDNSIDTNLMLSTLIENTPVNIIGFGNTETSVTGVKYEVESKILDLVSASPKTEVYIGNETVSSHCGSVDHGDSGGSVMISQNGSSKLMAITSRGQLETDYPRYGIFGLAAYAMTWAITNRASLPQLPTINFSCGPSATKCGDGTANGHTALAFIFYPNASNPSYLRYSSGTVTCSGISPNKICTATLSTWREAHTPFDIMPTLPAAHYGVDILIDLNGPVNGSFSYDQGEPYWLSATGVDISMSTPAISADSNWEDY